MDWNVTQKAGSPTTEIARDSRLVAAAHQFEASMMSELMRPLMENSLFADDDPSALGGQGSGGSNALLGFASEAFAGSLSEHAGFGIARQIISHLRADPDGEASQANQFLDKER
jgi:flagellar protein FlgJ